MNWYRCDFVDGDNKFYEINMSLDDFKNNISNKSLIRTERSLVLFPHKDPQGKDGLAAAQLKDLNPLYICCCEEWINAGNIKSFGVVDNNNEAWKQISEKALGERHILTPNKSLLLS